MSRSPNLPVERTIGELIGSMRRPKNETDTSWYRVGPSESHGVNFTNSWLNVDTGSSPDASWYLNSDGEVRLRGSISGGDVDTTIFVLPEGLRPEFEEIHIVGDDENGIRLDGLHFRSFEIGAGDADDDGGGDSGGGSG